MMNWREFITSDLSVLTGKPVVMGTRLAVGFLLDLFANGWTEEQLLNSYPQLTRGYLRAVFAFASECLRDEGFYTLVPMEQSQ